MQELGKNAAGVNPNLTALRTLSVLTDPANVQVKTITEHEIIAAVNGEWFEHEDKPFEDLQQLYEIIAGLTNHQLVIHAGRTATPDQNGRVRVTRHTHRRSGDAPFYQDRPAPTLTIDLDNTPIPAGCSWSDVPTMAAAVWNKLRADNPILTDVGCVWRTSGSAGIEGRDHLAKFHFTVILGNGLLWHDRESALSKINGADKAVARVVQKHYLGGRVCVGVVDPLEGQQTVGVFDGGFLWHPVTPAPVENPYEIDVTISDKTTDFGREKLRAVCATIANTPPGTRHDTVLRLSYLIGGYVGGGEISPADAYTHLKNAVAGFKRPKHHHHTISDAVPAGIDRPRSNVGDWATDILTRDFNVEALAEYALTLEDDQRDKLSGMVEELCSSKVAKQFAKALTGVENKAEVARSEERFAEHMQLGGELASFIIVKDNGEQSHNVVAYDTRTRVGRKKREFLELTSPLGTVAQINSTGKIVQTAVGEYWWNADQTVRFDRFGYDPNQGPVMVDHDNLTCWNTYAPAHPFPAPAGQDVSPFLYLLTANLPDQKDAGYLLAALAHAIQKPGERLLYAPVLQGGEGCGKGLLIKHTLMHCLGHRNIGIAKPDMLSEKYNAYMHHVSCVICDEIGKRKWADMNDIANALKEPITEPVVPIRKMRTDAFNVLNFTTWFFMTNHVESMLATAGRNRRYMHLISALQTEEQCFEAFKVEMWANYPDVVAAARPGAGWFQIYLKWFYEFGGAEAVRGYLLNIEAAHPGDAPVTAHRQVAKDAAVSPFERVLSDAIECGDVGFAGGLVSSNAIAQACRAEDLPVPSGGAMGRIMREMGYEFSARVAMISAEEQHFPQGVGLGAKRPRFVIYSKNPAVADMSPEAVVAMYTEAQRTAATGFGKDMRDDDRPNVH